MVRGVSFESSFEVADQDIASIVIFGYEADVEEETIVIWVFEEQRAQEFVPLGPVSLLDKFHAGEV